MSSLKYLKEAAALPKHFKNGMIAVELRPEGVEVVGYKDIPAEDGHVTMNSRITTWQVLEYASFNPLTAAREIVVASLRLEEHDDAGG